MSAVLFHIVRKKMRTSIYRYSHSFPVNTTSSLCIYIHNCSVLQGKVLEENCQAGSKTCINLHFGGGGWYLLTGTGELKNASKI
jgi:hypothetical protein